MNSKMIKPPFSAATAPLKVQLADDAWNSRDPERIAQTYTIDTEWRNRSEFINGREEVIAFLRNKWQTELHYKLKKSYGHSELIESQFALNMNIKIPMGNGSGLMVTRTGNSMIMD